MSDKRSHESVRQSVSVRGLRSAAHSRQSDSVRWIVYTSFTLSLSVQGELFRHAVRLRKSTRWYISESSHWHQGNAHRTRWASLLERRHSKLTRDGGRATPSGRTRGSNESYAYLLWESHKKQFLMCQVSIAYCCYVRSLNASSRNYKVMQMSSERFYTRGNQKTIHNFNKL